MELTNNASEPTANPAREVERDAAMFHLVLTLGLLAYSLLVEMRGGVLLFLSALGTLACLTGIIGAVYAFRGRREGLRMMLWADLCMTVVSVVLFAIAVAKALQPLPLPRYGTDDWPWLVAAARQIALWVSGGAMVAAVSLLISALLTKRRHISR